MTEATMITQDFVYCNYAAATQKDLFEQLAEDLAAKEIVQAGFANALLEREANFPTGLPVNHGVAIPHTDGTLVNADQLVFVTLDNPIRFNEMGGDEEDFIEVKVIILLAVKDGKKHLSILQTLIEAIQNAAFIDGLVAAEDEAQMIEIIQEHINEKEGN